MSTQNLSSEVNTPNAAATKLLTLINAAKEDPDATSQAELLLINPLAKKIFDQGLEMAKQNNLNTENVVNFTLGLMTKVEIEAASQKGTKAIVASGSGKKNMVMCIVRLIIKAVIENDAQEKLLLTYCDNYLPSVIDVVVSISNGEFNINDIGEIVSGCLPFGKKN